MRNLITSACGGLARGEGQTDFNGVKGVLAGYKDKRYLRLKKLCGEPISLWKSLFFNLFTRHRVGATDLGEFETVCELSWRFVEKPKPKTEAPAAV